MTTGDQGVRSEAPGGSRFVAIAVLTVAVVIWALAVTLPVWETRSDHDGRWHVVVGALPLMIGFLGILVLCPAWFANLLLIPLGFTLFKGRRRGFVLSVLVFAVAATAFMMPALYGDNETDAIVRRRIGFYLWLGCFAVLMLGHAFQANRADPSRARVRWITVAIMVLVVTSLQLIFRVGVSPLEAALKDPRDVASFSTELARHPSQADKDAALRWVMLQDLSSIRTGAVPPRIKALVDAGANVNQADRYGSTPLADAVSRPGAESVVELLVRSGANVNARDWRGKTILDIAEERGSSQECKQILIDAGAQRSSGSVQPPPATRNSGTAE